MQTKIREIAIEHEVAARGPLQRKRREREAETFDQALRENGVESARDEREPGTARSDVPPPEAGTGGRLDVVA